MQQVAACSAGVRLSQYTHEARALYALIAKTDQVRM